MDAPQSAMHPKRLKMELVYNFLKNHWRAYLILFLIAGIIVGFDQWTKELVRTKIPFGNSWLPDYLTWLLPYARIVHWTNQGAAFGIFQQGGLIFTILAIVVSVLIIIYFPHTSRQDWWMRLAIAMQLGGAVGNLIDRLAFGRVIDFISVGDFAVFNVADASISVGVAVLVFGVWLKERSEKKRITLAAPSENEPKRE